MLVDPISLANLIASFPYLRPIVLASLVVAIVISGTAALCDLPHVASKSRGIPAENVVDWLSKVARCYLSHLRNDAMVFAALGGITAAAFVVLVGVGFFVPVYLQIDPSKVPAIPPATLFATLRLGVRGLIAIVLSAGLVVCFIQAVIAFVCLLYGIYESAYSTACSIGQHYRASREAYIKEAM